MKKISDYEFQITSVSVGDDSSSLNMEADLDKYGKTYISLTLKVGTADGNTGSYSGGARTITASGELIRASLQGIWKREGALVHLKGLDNASNGDLNFGESTLDLIKKTCTGSVYEAWS